MDPTTIAVADPTHISDWVSMLVQFLLVAVFGTWAWVVRSAGNDIRNDLGRLWTEIHQNNIQVERRLTRAEAGLEFLLRQNGFKSINHAIGPESD